MVVGEAMIAHTPCRDSTNDGTPLSGLARIHCRANASADLIASRLSNFGLDLSFFFLPAFSEGMARRKRPADRTVLRREIEATKANLQASKALLGIKQGAAATPKQPFGGGRKKKSPQHPTSGQIRRYLNATLRDHLPLPRPTGPYTVIRLTNYYNCDSGMVTFGPEISELGNGVMGWSSIIGRASVNSAVAVSANNNCIALNMTALRALDNLTQIVPAALTVQVMNPEAVQTTSGMVWGGMSRTQLPIGSAVEPWDFFAQNFISLMTPRVMSAAKLAFKGVTGNAYPLNMSELSNFHQLIKSNGADAKIVTTWNRTQGTIPETDGQPTGMTPIVFVNPNRVDLIYQVTVEYRVRFALSNPASAGHIQHKAGSTALWDAAVAAAGAVGHGLMDIGEQVAADGLYAAAMA